MSPGVNPNSRPQSDGLNLRNKTVKDPHSRIDLTKWRPGVEGETILPVIISTNLLIDCISFPELLTIDNVT